MTFGDSAKKHRVVGSFTTNTRDPSQAKTSAICFSKEIAGRFLYLKNNCDAFLDGSIRRGIGIAIRGHWDEYAQKETAMYNCTTIALG